MKIKSLPAQVDHWVLWNKTSGVLDTEVDRVSPCREEESYRLFGRKPPLKLHKKVMSRNALNLPFLESPNPKNKYCILIMKYYP